MPTDLTTVPATTYEGRAPWRKGRRRVIGASDAAAIWGASGWQSPYSVWWSKVGPLEPDYPDIVQRVGHALEPLVAEMFTELTGVPLDDPGDFTIFTHPEVRCMGCTPDRITSDGSAVVELKTAHFGSADEWKSHIPLGYQTQLQHQMIVMGVERAFIAVLINSTTFKHHEMRLSQNFARRHIAKCKSFWEQYVETKTAPPTDYSKATSQALARQWAASRKATVDLPGDCESLAARYDKLAKLSSSVDRQQEAIKNRIKAAMGDAQLGRLSDESGFQWSGAEGKRRFTRKKKVYGDDE